MKSSENTPPLVRNARPLSSFRRGVHMLKAQFGIEQGGGGGQEYERWQFADPGKMRKVNQDSEKKRKSRKYAWVCPKKV